MDEATVMDDSLGVEDDSVALVDERDSVDRVISLDANELDNELNVSELGWVVDVVDEASPVVKKDSLSVDVVSLKLEVVDENSSLDRVTSLDELDEDLNVSELSWVIWLDVVDEASSVEDDGSLIVEEPSLALELVDMDGALESEETVSVDNDVEYTEDSKELEEFQPFHELKVSDDDESSAVGINTSTVVTPPDEASSVVVAV